MLNKIDALDDDIRQMQREELEAVAGPVMLMSGVSGEGVEEVLRRLATHIEQARRAERDETEDAGPWRP